MRLILSLILLLVLVNSSAQVDSDSAKSKSLVGTRAQNLLIVINGIEQKKRGIQTLDSINPNQIESINILKDKAAMDKYGERGKDGVIEITTKVVVKELKLEELKDDGDGNNAFYKVEVEPAFRGGDKEWKAFLMKNLNPLVPVENGASAGTYTVVLQFIVDKEGTISDIKALTNHGHGMEEECIRLMKLSPKWLPAIQNGRNVKAYKKQPITFVISVR